ncbi:MAG: hypothetical protein ACR2LM_10505 [Pyrinomonadaceae bacterium]
MKIILSRKGFDSSFGGCASPIFPDGSLVTLPIPEDFVGVPSPTRPITYAELLGSPNIGVLVTDLTRQLKKPIDASDLVHLDPDLRPEALSRDAGWRPIFGQSHAAGTHLKNQHIGEGDIFLFFGWFREVEERDGRWNFKRGVPDLHVIFGWLEVGEVRNLENDLGQVPEWARSHPHVTPDYGPNNTLYVAATINGHYSAGNFPTVSEALTLTREGSSRSSWRLPKGFHPVEGKSSLSYHSNPKRWRLDGDFTNLTSVGRGQEFVLDTADYPEAEGWARKLIADNSQ